MNDEFSLTLAHLADEARSVQGVPLAPLSDMSRERLGEFEAVWAELSDARRLAMVRRLVEAAEEDVCLDFRAIMRASLRDRQASVRRLAVEGLWEDERPSLTAPLIELLAGDPAVEVRAAAAISLGRFVWLGVLEEISAGVARRVEEALWRAWSTADEALDVRRRALEALAFDDQPELLSAIQIAYGGTDPLLRQSAVFAMGRNGDPSWGKPVLAELSSDDPAMRFEAAAAAGELGLTAAVRPLAGLLGDADPAVRETAAAALGKIGGREAKAALQDAARRPDARLAEAAQEALAELSFNNDLLNTAPSLASLEQSAPPLTEDEDDAEEEWEASYDLEPDELDDDFAMEEEDDGEEDELMADLFDGLEEEDDEEEWEEEDAEWEDDADWDEADLAAIDEGDE